jgi:hypothetical protein
MPNTTLTEIFKEASISEMIQKLNTFFKTKENEIFIDDAVTQALDYIGQNNKPIKALYQSKLCSQPTLNNQLIERESHSLISLLLSFQMTNMQDLIKLAIENKNNKMLASFFQSDDFYLSNYDKQKLIEYSYQCSNGKYMHLVHDYVFEQMPNFEFDRRNFPQIVENILISKDMTRFDYFEEKFHVNIKQSNYETEAIFRRDSIESILVRVMLESDFLESSIEKQIEVLDYLYPISNSILTSYFIRAASSECNQENFSDILSFFIENEKISYADLKSQARNEHFKSYFHYFENVYSMEKEAKMLSNNISEVNSTKSKIKI